MKISLACYYDNHGGGGKAVRRLHERLLRDGQASSLLVCRKETDLPNVFNLAPGWRAHCIGFAQRLAARIASLQQSGNPMPHSLNIFPAPLKPSVASFAADVLNLHWVNGEMLSIAEIESLARSFPLVWTFHDAWPLCGSEHHPKTGGNERWRNGYSSSNREDPGLDIDRFIWRRKLRHWRGLDFHVAAPSKWMASLASSSALFRSSTVKVIPNGLDLNLFRPEDKAKARKRLKLPPEKLLLGFGSVFVGNKNKGAGELPEILGRLKGAGFQNLELATVGSGSFNHDLPFPATHLGSLDKEPDMKGFYNAIDVFALPSRQDNLPNMIMEAMACGVPCVSYGIGGIPELIDHQANGYLARPFDVEDFSRGVASMLAEGQAGSRSASARAKIESAFDIENVCRSYLDFYKEAIARRQPEAERLYNRGMMKP